MVFPVPGFPVNDMWSDGRSEASPTSERSLSMSTVAAAALVGTAASYVGEAKRVDRASAAAGVPLVAWLAFATVLTADIWRRNR